MKLIFTLSMPGVAWWNGKWSGEGKHYCIIKPYRGKRAEARALGLVGSYGYNFGDGWYARVDVSSLIGKSPKSDGFCGYDWMVTSILSHREILNDAQVKKLREATSAKLEALSLPELMPSSIARIVCPNPESAVCDSGEAREGI
jgi:hypothetical protein